MNNNTTTAWQLYEAGKDYKRRIGLYETVRRNERFYRGDQWHGTDSDLPRPVFNLIRRITDYLVCTIVPGDLSIRYSDDKLPFLDSEALRTRVSEGISILNRNAAYRWKRNGMQELAHKALLNAAISGDGVFYCWWDGTKESGQPFVGDIRTDLLDNTDLFVADVNKTDIQSQEYVILAGRATVSSLRREALENGLDRREIDKIVGDRETETRAGDYASYELQGAEKATYLLRFYREGGEVVFEKSTRNVILRRVHTGLKYYPVAYFNWYPTKNSFHGTSPVTSMVPNQKFINRAYAMAMKHMTDTAFSKVIYDKSRIPEWSNEIGEAIAAMGGGNISDAVSVVGAGDMQNGFMDLINSAVTLTKELMGATESALGNMEARNTSAILALQETSRIALDNVRYSFYAAIEELAAIWADMICAYYTDDRLLPCANGADITARQIDVSLLRRAAVSARVDVTEISRFSAAAAQNILDKLLEKGYVSPAEYVRRLPAGLISDKQSLIEQIENGKDVAYGRID